MALWPKTAGRPLLRVTASSANQEEKALPPPAATAWAKRPSSSMRRRTPGLSCGWDRGFDAAAGWAKASKAGAGWEPVWGATWAERDWQVVVKTMVAAS